MAHVIRILEALYPERHQTLRWGGCESSSEVAALNPSQSYTDDNTKECGRTGNDSQAGRHESLPWWGADISQLLSYSGEMQPSHQILRFFSKHLNVYFFKHRFWYLEFEFPENAV